MTQRVAVVGAGSWGTAVAALTSTNVSTVLWARRPELAEQIATKHENGDYLAGLALPDALDSTSDVRAAVDGADVVVMGVPSHGFRAVLTELLPGLAAGVPVVSLSKGMEADTQLRMTEVIAQVAPGHPAGVLTGPNLAKEVVQGSPAAAVVAFHEESVAEALQGVFSTNTFRVYRNDDVVGCEVAGALKNVLAIAAGMADGMNFGDNTKAALLTRGLAELTRLGVALGGNPLTFAGLAGMGDLVATCSSRQSRNRHVGEELGKGRKLEDIVSEMKMVAEGVKTARSVVTIANHAGVEMPIAEQVVAVLDGEVSAADVIVRLMSRSAKAESHGIA
ncbi:MAG TPA: NAD(P)H-dependent glycerol-3-phosphate dehydrogenase [Acidimicrobiales bacterium]|nr:NAD(P)H-dependent glycerol-3-phosphate dehydrogenase [Acidimicrobiales bacterium]